MSQRADASPGQFINPHAVVTFTFAGRPVQAYAGQSIAAALYAAGTRIFSRSFKYHRPRGLLCVSGDCPNCLMQVDGRPNVRTCLEPVGEGQVVLPQNAWPSLNFDVLRVFDYLDAFLPVGFYYRRFHKPRWMWPVFERVVRRIAGLGRIDVHARPETPLQVEHLHADVCVIGGGPAGIAAANEAARTGVQVLLVERLPDLGGHLLYERMTDAGVPSLDDRVPVLRAATAFGLYEGNLLGAFQGERFLKIRAGQIVVCTGGRQRPFVFHNNDLPGIFLSRGVLRLARLYGVRAGRRALVLADSDAGPPTARQLEAIGIEVVAIVDSRLTQATGSQPWPILRGDVLEALGSRQLEGVRVALRDGHGRILGDDEIGCDLLCMASSLDPANELLLQAGVRFRQENGRWRPENEAPGVWAAGAAAGTLSLRTHESEGRLRGAEAAVALGYHAPQLDELRRHFQALQADDELEQRTTNPILIEADSRLRKCFICLCEDVTEKDLVQAVGEGFDNIETLKRYSTVNMGPCQGKMCGLTAVETCSRLTGRDTNAVGVTTSRPPAVPVEMCVLAADRRHHPVRRTPMHYWHEAAGAKWLDAGLWKRPEHYGDPGAEVRTVRNSAGLIDVSTLGKIELIGPDAAELLERVYVNKWDDLKEGRVRYGVMCNEDGILFDDGVGVRRAPNHYYITATTGNADAVFQWFEMWRATWGLDVVLLNQTAAMAAMNLAGPRSRDILRPLTGVDLDRFPYMAWRSGHVAGVPCLLLRIGFVGELGYEIHCPSIAAEHVWKAIHAAGEGSGLRSFGVEAQRILRLEKGHVILGVDTDATSNPLDAGLEGVIRFEKPAFHGRDPLLRLKARGSRMRLVGFRLRDSGPADLRELEGCQVVAGGRPAGRITSVRRSPTLECAIGLAWVPASVARAGQSWHVRCQEKDLTCEVMALPFYDPEMARQKS